MFLADFLRKYIKPRFSCLLAHVPQHLVVRLIFAMGFMLFFFATADHVYAAKVALAWDAPRIHSNKLGGYNLYYWQSSWRKPKSIKVGKQRTYTVAGLKAGQTYHFAITAYDRKGANESAFSNKVKATIPADKKASVAHQGTRKATDTDRDGLTDVRETTVYGTDPTKADSDGDGINDGDEVEFWGPDWDADRDDDGLINLLDPDTDNDGSRDGIESNHGFDSTDPASKPEFPPLETGEVRVRHTWVQVKFRKPFIDPVVVVKPLSLNGSHPAVVRLRNVRSTGFEIRVQEWDYLNGSHPRETIGYLVMERGHYTLPDGTQVEADSFRTRRTSTYKVVPFTQAFAVAPVVLTAVSSVNGGQAVTTRVRHIRSQRFEVRMQEQERNAQVHVTETIAYIAWEPSAGTVDGFTFEVNKTRNVMTHTLQTILYTTPFTNIPVFLADIQTVNGGNTANLRWANKDIYGVDVQIDEEQSKNRETNHTAEAIGYILISPHREP